MTAGPRHRFQSRLAGGSDGCFEADAGARLAGVTVGDLQLAELAFVDGLVQSRVAGAAAALSAVLHDHPVLLLRLPGDAAFGDVVAHRLFDVDMLAGLGGPDRHQRMPVVRGGDRDGVERLVFQRLADIGHALAGEFALDLLLQGFQSLIQHVLVGINKVGDFHVGLFQIAADVVPPRPLTPATAMRRRSLAPNTRDEAAVPHIKTPAPAADDFKKSRRVTLAMVAVSFIEAILLLFRTRISTDFRGSRITSPRPMCRGRAFPRLAHPGDGHSGSPQSGCRQRRPMIEASRRR